MSGPTGQCPFCDRVWVIQGQSGRAGCGEHLWSAQCQRPGCPNGTDFVRRTTFTPEKTAAVCLDHKDQSEGWRDVHGDL